MTTCLRCHRPLKNPAINGMGPVCAKAVQPVAEVERDLFGVDVEAAALAAKARLDEFIRMRVTTHKHMIRWDFEEARQRLGVQP